jgi:hypothetical protein
MATHDHTGNADEITPQARTLTDRSEGGDGRMAVQAAGEPAGIGHQPGNQKDISHTTIPTLTGQSKAPDCSSQSPPFPGEPQALVESGPRELVEKGEISGSLLTYRPEVRELRVAKGQS